MHEDVIIRTSEDGVLRITWNRPDVLNALATEHLATAAEAIESARVRAVYLTGTGRAFSTGADLGSGDVFGFQLQGNRLVRAITAAPCPVVAGVNGIAAGMGAAIALAADFTVMNTSGYFLQSFVNIGLMPDGGLTRTLAAAVGRARANSMAMLGERLPAAEAASLGLIQRAVANADFEDVVEALVARLATGPTVAYAATKAALNANTLARLNESLDFELVEQQRLLAHTQDSVEGRSAFLEKRAARFAGA